MVFAIETMAKPANIGRKISRILELRGIKQEHLAMELGHRPAERFQDGKQ